ncbi:MAG: hypothetical protein K8R02_07350 [Anaerohalosphaeraceae bacterium]|nr:hypothetical protein [Anaerohalosphaeraceae bacterium]
MRMRKRKMCRGKTAPAGAVLAEVIMVVFIVAMITSLVMINFATTASSNSFRARANDLVRLFKMAVTTSAQTDRRYEVVIDFSQNSYLLREITTGLVAVEDIKEEEIITRGEFNDSFQLSYVMFDDGEWTNEAPALFRCSKSGWQYGGKVVVSDDGGNLYSIVINRLNRIIELRGGDVELLETRTQDEMGF